MYTFATKQGLNESERKVFVDAFRQLTVYKEKDYGAYSAKAIGRLLPLMRRGKYWNPDAIDSKTHEHIEHLIIGEVDDA